MDLLGAADKYASVGYWVRSDGFRERAAILDHTVRVALSPLHTSRAPGAIHSIVRWIQSRFDILSQVRIYFDCSISHQEAHFIPNVSASFWHL